MQKIEVLKYIANVLLRNSLESPLQDGVHLKWSSSFPSPVEFFMFEQTFKIDGFSVDTKS
jgi:hypothetical protein